MIVGADQSFRDPVRSVFGVALVLGLAALLLREAQGVRLAHESLGVVLLGAWLAAVVSVLVSLVDVARNTRVRSLYLAVAMVAGHVLAFGREMDGGARSTVAGVLWLLLGAVIVVEVVSLARRSRPTDDGVL